MPFARANPQIEITVSKHASKHPHVQALYIADGTKAVSLRNYSATQVAYPSRARGDRRSPHERCARRRWTPS